MTKPVDLATALAALDEPWSPQTVLTMNDYDIRVVKTRGEFTRHSHPETDEFFLVLRGALTIKMESGDVTLGPGQMFVVPRGVPHQPLSTDGADVVLIEPSETVKHRRHTQPHDGEASGRVNGSGVLRLDQFRPLTVVLDEPQSGLGDLPPAVIDHQ